MRDCLPVVPPRSAGWWWVRLIRRRGAAGHGVRGGPASGGSVTVEAFGCLERDVGGARGVAARDGGQALHVRAEQLGEGAGLGLAQLRELRGHVGDRAVVLAQLHARGACRCRPRGSARRSPGRPARRASAATRSCGAPGRDDLRRGGAEQVRDALGGETVDRLLARVRGEEAQRGDGEVVVAVPEPGPAGVGEQVVPRRAPPAARAAPGRVAQLGLAGLDQRVEVPADRRAPTAPARPRPPPRCTAPAPSAAGRPRCGCGPRDGPPRHRCRDRRRRPGPGARGPGPRREPGAAFHNTSVTYIRRDRQSRPPWREAG